MGMLNQDIYRAKYKTGKLSVIKVKFGFSQRLLWDSLGIFKSKS